MDDGGALGIHWNRRCPHKQQRGHHHHHHNHQRHFPQNHPQQQYHKLHNNGLISAQICSIFGHNNLQLHHSSSRFRTSGVRLRQRHQNNYQIYGRNNPQLQHSSHSSSRTYGIRRWPQNKHQIYGWNNLCPHDSIRSSTRTPGFHHLL